MRDCYLGCTDHEPPLDAAQCGCGESLPAHMVCRALRTHGVPCAAVAACDLSTCSNDPNADGPTRDEIEGWIAGGCQGGDDGEPCSFQWLMDAAEEAVRHNDMDGLARHPAYRACAEAARQIGDARIGGSCERGP